MNVRLSESAYPLAQFAVVTDESQQREEHLEFLFVGGRRR